MYTYSSFCLFILRFQFSHAYVCVSCSTVGTYHPRTPKFQAAPGSLFWNRCLVGNMPAASIATPPNMMNHAENSPKLQAILHLGVQFKLERIRVQQRTGYHKNGMKGLAGLTPVDLFAPHKGPKDHINGRILQNMISGIPLISGLGTNVRSLCLCGLLGPYS